MEPTIVVFRKWPNGDVLALFPAEDANGDGRYCTAYEHVGQHGAADYQSCLRCTTPALPNEFAALQRELESKPYEYRLLVRRRYIRRRK